MTRQKKAFEPTLSRRRLALGAASAAVLAVSAGMPAFAAQNRAAVIYYSWSGSTERAAREIARQTGAKLIELEVREPYDSVYSRMTTVAQNEVRNLLRRELAQDVGDLSEFDVIYLGTPFWWGSCASPVHTFLMDHPLEGKEVHPFVVSASSGPEGAYRRIRELAPKARVREDLHLTTNETADCAAAVEAWLKRA